MKFEKKTIAILLVVVIGLSFSVGLASAAGENNPILAAINNAVITLQNAITIAQNNINTHTDTEINKVEPNSLVVRLLIDVPHPQTYIILLPHMAGQEKTYCGHISLNLSPSPAITLEVDGDVGYAPVSFGTVDFEGNLNVDFAVQGLSLIFRNSDATTHSAYFTAVIQYTNCTNVSTLPQP